MRMFMKLNMNLDRQNLENENKDSEMKYFSLSSTFFKKLHFSYSQTNLMKKEKDNRECESS